MPNKTKKPLLKAVFLFIPKLKDCLFIKNLALNKLPETELVEVLSKCSATLKFSFSPN